MGVLLPETRFGFFFAKSLHLFRIVSSDEFFSVGPRQRVLRGFLRSQVDDDGTFMTILI
jgi:hypothetical protein